MRSPELGRLIDATPRWIEVVSSPIGEAMKAGPTTISLSTVSGGWFLRSIANCANRPVRVERRNLEEGPLRR